MALPNILATATFTAANGQSISSDSNWTVAAGTFLIWDNRGRSNSAGNNYAYHAATVPTTNNYGVKCTCRRLTNNGSYNGPAVRVSTSAATMYFTRWNYGSDSVELFKMVAGTATLLVSSNATAPPNGTDYTLELRCLNNTLQVYLNNTKVIDTTDSSIASGQGGIRSNNASGTTAGTHIDNWELNDAATGIEASTINGKSAEVSGTSTAVNSVSGTVQGPISTISGSTTAVSRIALSTLQAASSLVSGISTGVNKVQGVIQGPQSTLSGTSTAVNRIAASTLQAVKSLLSGFVRVITGPTDYTTSEEITVLLDDTEVEVGAELNDFSILYDHTTTITMYTYATVPDSLVKDATANARYTFNWKPWLGSRTITIASVFAPGLTILAVEIVEGNKVIVWLGGGTLNKIYDVKCTINFTPEESLLGGVDGIESRTITLKVVNR